MMKNFLKSFLSFILGISIMIIGVGCTNEETVINNSRKTVAESTNGETIINNSEESVAESTNEKNTINNNEIENINVEKVKPMISAKSAHMTALKNDGTVWCWGQNNYGQLGDGTKENSSMPIQVKSLTNIMAVSAGNNHTTALKNDGTVWCWGQNNYGQLGDGIEENRSIPVQVKNLTNITEVSAGVNYTVALKSDGTVWCWGSNDCWQLGNGTTENSNIPVQVKDLTDVIAISTGSYHTEALKNDGTVWCWGPNGYGHLGNGTAENSSIPVQVKGLTGVIAISAGSYHTTALKSDGTVWCWGNNLNGQLGDETVSGYSNIPIQVKGLTDVTAVSAGGFDTEALKSDGTVWLWGASASGNSRGNWDDLVPGKPVKVIIPRNGSIPVKVKDLINITSVSIGRDDTGAYTLALKSDGTVWRWEPNGCGQLEDEMLEKETIEDINSPVQVKGLNLLSNNN